MKRESGYNGCGLMAFLVCMMVPAMVMGALGAPVNPSSDSHKAGVCNSDRTVNMAWDAPEPVESVQGYSVLWDSLSDTLPEATLATTQTHATSPYLDIGNYYYVHIRAVDNEDNWGETALHVGPFCIKTYEDPCDASGTAGDINGDERLDLSDAILGLNLVSAGENTIEAEADVNQDDLIGLAEVIYILKRMASCQGFQPGDCLRPEEVELARLVNEYRQKNGLDELAISKSLTQTAQQHLTDLHENEPDAGEDCSQHSWGEFSEAYWGEWLHVSEYPSEENLAVEILELKKDFNEDEKEEDVPENSPDRYWEMRLKHKESMRVIKTTEVKSMMHKFVTRTIVVIMAVLTLAMILPPAHAEAGGFTLENATVGESLPAGTVVGRLVAVDAGCLSSHLCPDSRHGGE